MYEDPTGRRNSSGAPDHTAYRAVTRTQDEDAAMPRLIELRRIIWSPAEHDGVYARVEPTDKRMGRRRRTGALT